MSRLLSRGNAAILVGLVLLSFNLRPTAVSVGPVLAEVRDGLDMSAASTGLLTSLPVLAFAGFGAAAPALAAKVGVHRVTLVALMAVVAGLGARVTASGELGFLVFSMVALAGMAMANVLLPSLVKLHFPDRIGQVTALYTGALSIGLTAALMLTVPVSEATGTWRLGLGVWAVLALVAAVPWIGLAGHDRTLERRRSSVRLVDVARTPLGLAMALAFGLQSMQAYIIFGWFAQLWRDAGFSPTVAGLLGRARRRHQHPALAVAALPAGGQPAARRTPGVRGGLLPRGVRRPDGRAPRPRGALGGADRHRDHARSRWC